MGRAFTERQESDIRNVIRRAEAETGLHFSVYVGRAEGDARRFARALHASLGDRVGDAVLLFVDPDGHAMEIVTGPRARRLLDDRTCALAAMTMTTSFSVGDLVAGICDGINLLVEHGRRAPVEHRHPAG